MSFKVKRIPYKPLEHMQEDDRFDTIVYELQSRPVGEILGCIVDNEVKGKLYIEKLTKLCPSIKIRHSGPVMSNTGVVWALTFERTT